MSKKCCQLDNPLVFVLVNHSTTISLQDIKVLSKALKRYVNIVAEKYETYPPQVTYVLPDNVNQWPIPVPIPDPDEDNPLNSPKPAIPVDRVGLKKLICKIKCKTIIPVYILNTAPDYIAAGILGFHWLQGNVPTVYIFADRISTIFFDGNNPTSSSVSQILSDEIGEVMRNPYINQWYQVDNLANDENTPTTYVFAEIADPVQENYFVLEVEGIQVKLVDFVMLDWYDPFNEGNLTKTCNNKCNTRGEITQFNKLKTLKEPFELGPGGKFPISIFDVKNGRNNAG